MGGVMLGPGNLRVFQLQVVRKGSKRVTFDPPK